jgi:hypothetical protein
MSYFDENVQFLCKFYANKKATIKFRSQLFDFQVGPPGHDPGTH